VTGSTTCTSRDENLEKGSDCTSSSFTDKDEENTEDHESCTFSDGTSSSKHFHFSTFVIAR